MEPDPAPPFEEVSIEIAGRVWQIRAVRDQDALVANIQSDEDLARFPYGLTLWSSAVALADRLAQEPALTAGKRVLELGAGAGLPGIVARYLGGEVTQTDYDERALALAYANARANGIAGIRLVELDWRRRWNGMRYDVILGADVLYEASLHKHLRSILEEALRPDGLVLISDPLRPHAVEFVSTMESAGWEAALDARNTVWEWESREIAIFTLRRCREGLP